MARPLQQIGALLVLTVMASAAQSAAVYALGSNNSTLVRFDTAAPGAVTIVGALGGATTQLDGIDFRVADGALQFFGRQARQAAAPLRNCLHVSQDHRWRSRHS